jgi:DNA-binding MarR family transcriptional regulator
MAQRKLFNYVDKACEDALDTSVTQLAALLYIVKHSGCLQKDLAKALSLNKSAMTGLIVRMEKNELLERFVSDEDARAIKLYPTQKGVQKTLDLMPFIDELNDLFSEDFTDEAALLANLTLVLPTNLTFSLTREPNLSSYSRT